MLTIKCKMCGGTVEFETGATVGVCDSCGTKQTLPRLDDDRKANLYDRANHFRRNNEYDKAMSIYEQILNEDSTDAESYWSIVLCKYGIEYVEDPTTHKRVPTVNRAQFTSVVADEDYKKAIEYADIEQKILYEAEAKTIDEIQKGILEISQKEEPFDVFICYKETDNNGRRTQDSVLANDLYHQLVQEGFKVFFSRITLEDKLGTAYEPYIFAALNSSKVMVVLGTKPEYFNAVWVKNEWSRYLTLIKSGAKKMLIPAYKDMDPYDLPEEFSHLQAQDMSRLGFMQDLIRGIKKILGEEPKYSQVTEQVGMTNGYSANTSALLKRGYMALEDSDWDKAYDFFEEVLNNDPECAVAYMGQFLASRQNASFEQVIRGFISESEIGSNEIIKIPSKDDEQHINEIIETCTVPGYLDEAEIADAYKFDWSIKSTVNSLKKYKKTILDDLQNDKKLSRAIKYADGDYKEKLDSHIESLEVELNEHIKLAEERDRVNTQKKVDEYNNFLSVQDKLIHNRYEQACSARDSDAKENEYAQLRRQQKEKRGKTIGVIISFVLILLLALGIIINQSRKKNNYRLAIQYLETGEYEQARGMFENLASYERTQDYLNLLDLIEEANKMRNGTNVSKLIRELRTYSSLFDVDGYISQSEELSFAESIEGEWYGECVYHSHPLYPRDFDVTVIIGEETGSDDLSFDLYYCSHSTGTGRSIYFWDTDSNPESDVGYRVEFYSTNGLLSLTSHSIYSGDEPLRYNLIRR